MIDLNSDLGESLGPWRMGDDAAMLDGDSPGAVEMARRVKDRLQEAGVGIGSFVEPLAAV